MKTSSREKNFIVFTFGFYIVLFIILLIFSFKFFLPNIKDIEAKKQELKQLYVNKTELEQKGLSFEEFKSLNQTSNDKYFISILSSIDKNFYENNFINKSDTKFEEFITKKTFDINSGDNNEKLLLLNSKISKMLPSYLKNYTGVDKNNFTNFKYINYLESIFQTFGLKTNESLGIKEIELLTDYSQLEGNANGLDVNLFSIPFKLTLKGKKEGIINFIHFAKNVGNININDNSTDFALYNDNYLKTKYGEIVIKGNNYQNNGNYNIYENQIFEIDYIKMNNYIDSSNSTKGNTDIANYVKNTQGNEDFEIEVFLKFYIKGIQQYQLSEYILSIYDKYNKLNNEANNKINDVNTSKFDILTYKNISKYLNEINPEMKNINKELAQNNNLEQLYSKIVKYNISLSKIEKLLPIK